jgi:hypothetical protein
LLALAAALYKVSSQQRYRHVITVSNDSVCIDKGYHKAVQHWQFARQSAGLTITAEQHPSDKPGLCLHDRNDSVLLGEFLNREDSLKLISLLQQEIRVRAQGACMVREF